MSKWNEKDHPRVPAGNPDGGQFTSWSRAPAIRRKWDDNPGGSWLEHEQQLAEKRMAEGRKVSGSPTAGFIGRLPAKMVAEMPGLMDEQQLTDLLRDDKASSIRASIEKVGVKKPIFINVNHKGQAFINEGNHRAAISAAAGHLTVPVEVRYFAGGETAPGRMNINRLTEKIGMTRKAFLEHHKKGK